MRYDWNKDLGQGQNLKTFGEAIPYFGSCMVELYTKIKDQLGNLELMRDSMKNHRIFVGGSDRTGWALSIIPYYLRRYGKYNGKIRPDVYQIGKDPNIPTHDPKTDVGIVGSGSSLRKPSVDAMKVLIEDMVETYFLTYTTLEEARKEQERVEEETGELIESVWDYFIKQKDWEKHVIYLPMREEVRKRERKRASLAPEGTKYEICTAVFSYSLADNICRSHLMNDTKNSNIPVESVLSVITDFGHFLINDVNNQCYDSRYEIANFIQSLYDFKHKNVVGFGLSEFNRDSFVNRLTHCRHLGKAEVYEKDARSVHAIRSLDFGDITEEDLFVGISRSGDNPLTWFVLQEAIEKGAKKLYLITCNSKPEIDAYTNKIVLPPIINNQEDGSYKGNFGPLSIYTFLDSCIAQLADDMDLDEPELTSFHSRHG